MSDQQLFLSAVVAMTPERVIGLNGQLPWHLPEDLKVFRRITTGHPIVMGRKTFDSIGKPLPNRQNIVLTRDTNWSHDGVEVIHKPSELKSLHLTNPTVYIIGGSEIYSAFLPHLQELYVSEVHTAYEGDTFFPEFRNYFQNREIVDRFDDFTLVRYTKD